MRSLQGRVAVVTGAAGGIGLGIAEALATDGAHVAVVDVDGSAAERAAGRLQAAGQKAIAVTADVVDRAAVDAMAATVVDRLGGIDILAANAGIYPTACVTDVSAAEWDRVMDVNVKGVLHSMQACLPAMRRRGYGRIVITSSITGPLVGSPGRAHYAASKAALLGLMRSAALELAGAGITVNAVQPGNVRTPGLEAFGEEFIREMIRCIPMKRLGEPADVGWAVRFLASDEASYITGQTIVIDGGQVLPESGQHIPGG